jgi:cell fate (sporulation/competence/biofilm development) regulator YmcA (YheA/YmcA/DUF963 family)
MNNLNGGITMVGVMKECVKCGKPFMTMSTKTGWQKLCSECYQMKKSSRAVKTMGIENQNILMGVESRLSKLENMFDFTPLIQQEIQNHMNMISGSDLRTKIDKQVKSVLTELRAQNRREFNELKDKLQKQTVVLSNRLIELEGRLNKWLEEN